MKTNIAVKALDERYGKMRQALLDINPDGSYNLNRFDFILVIEDLKTFLDELKRETK